MVEHMVVSVGFVQQKNNLEAFNVQIRAASEINTISLNRRSEICSPPSCLYVSYILNYFGYDYKNQRRPIFYFFFFDIKITCFFFVNEILNER